jgi:hypothetical protein
MEIFIVKKNQILMDKLSFCWKVSGPRAVNFLHEIAPYLGVRRYNRVIQCLALYKQERNL